MVAALALSLAGPARAEGDEFRTNPPIARRALTFSPSTLHASLLKNGAKLLTAERSDISVTALRIVVGFDAHDTIPGLASLYAEMLGDGTDVGHRFNLLGVKWHASAGRDTIVLEARFLEPVLAEALRLAADLLMHTEFSGEDVERARRQQEAKLNRNDSGPSTYFDSILRASIVDANHPYAESLLGSRASLRAITKADLVRFRDKYVQPHATTLCIVAALPHDKLRNAAESAFSEWSGPPVTVTGIRMPEPRYTERLTAVDAPASVQSLIGIAATTEVKDYESVLLLKSILRARLRSRLRQQLGITYGAQVSMSRMGSWAQCLITTAVTRERAAEALQIIHKELQRLVVEPLSSEDLTMAKTVAEAALAAGVETPSDLANRLAFIAEYHLSPQHDQEHLKRLRDATGEQVTRVASKLFQSDRMRTVVLGSIEPIRAELTAIAEALRPGSGKPTTSTVRYEKAPAFDLKADTHDVRNDLGH